MAPWKRLLFYLILNVIVAAATTLAVLFWWDRTHRAELPVAVLGQPAATAPSGTQPAVPPPSAQVTLPPAGMPVIEIKNVFGAGDVQNEVVVLQRVGDGELSLSGWKLKDDDGNEYVFPDLVLNKGGAVQLYSRAGTDTVIELFWGQTSAVWQTGEQVTLLDPLGNERATYLIP